MGFGLSAAGQGHAQAPARRSPQGSTITQSFTFTGSGLAVITTGRVPYVGTNNQGQLADGTKFTESFSGIGYAPAANGCSAATDRVTRTFATPGDTYDYVGVGEGCPVPGHAGQAKSTFNFVIIGGTGRYQGAIGTGTFTFTCTDLPTKVAGQYTSTCPVGQGSVTITLAGH
jgi:hypothetical protein